MSAAKMIALNGGGSGNPTSGAAPTSPNNSVYGRYDALLLRIKRSQMLGRHFFSHRVCIWSLLIACSVTIVIVTYQPVRIVGNSMAPLLSDHEAIFINRIVYHLDSVQRGDVVVFDYPLDGTKLFIKRIVALPGETIEIRRGLVYVNGKWLPEPYVPSQYRDPSDFGPLKVPSDSYFVLGDHRNGSDDSRAFGTVARRLVRGRAVLAYWPVSDFGSLSATPNTQASRQSVARRARFSRENSAIVKEFFANAGSPTFGNLNAMNSKEQGVHRSTTGVESEEREFNGKSRNQKVCAHPMQVHRSTERTVLRGSLSRCG